uniref:NEDD4-like E3 ubiquitin-protein ligase WWP1 n=1 Tax=Anthurium amnicola TaxID=1678845 RepID=A0A1D1YZQ1_9ARAE
MISKMSRNFLLIGIFIIQIITIVKSQDASANQATSSTPNPSLSPNPTEQPFSLVYHIVKVPFKDNSGLVGYSQNNFTADKGHSVRFEWVNEEIHSVVESTTDNPCQTKQGGFNLGKHSSPFNNSFIITSLVPIVFFSDVGDDCAKGMYGGINLPKGYNWPANLAAPPKQIVPSPLNSPTPTPTGSMSIAAASAEKTGGGSSSSSSDSVSTSYYLKESSFGIITGSLMLISFYFNVVIN